MTRSGVTFGIARDHGPGRLVQLGVEAGQHHRAMRQPGDGREQLGGRRHRSGRSGGDHRSVVLERETARLGRDQKVAPRRRLDRSALGQNGGPGLARDLQELQCELPILVEAIRHQLVELLPRHLARRQVVHQAREIVGERKCSGRPGDDQRSVSFAAQRRGLRPAGHQLGEQQPPLEPVDRRRQVEHGLLRHRGLRERDLVLVDIAERHDARQDRGPAARDVEEPVAHEAAGAPGRQVEGGGRKREWIARRRKTERAVDQRADERRHERRRGRDGEDAGTAG